MNRTQQRGILHNRLEALHATEAQRRTAYDLLVSSGLERALEYVAGLEHEG